MDISLLPRGMRAPRRGYPLLVFMHGCCSGNKTSWEATSVDAAGEKWHHSNAYFASRGYVVITYTARGFRNASDQGSSGTTQLDSRRFEINDYRYLAGLLADSDAARRAAGKRPLFKVDPGRVATVGGSYGGGFSWLALTDPRWRSPASGRRLKLGAVVTKYGWTDLVEALVPSGHYLDVDPTTGSTAVAPTRIRKALSSRPIGVEKQSIVAGLYASGNLASGNHTTFPEYLHTTYARLQQGEPSSPSSGIAGSIAPKYPITTYLGDYQHFVQNKAKEWGDLCGADHHVCTFEDYVRPGGFNLNRAPSRVRQGVDSKMSLFLDHYLRGRGRRPRANVTATTTICDSNASERYPVDEPGIEYRASRWRSLAPGTSTFRFGPGTTFSDAVDTRSDADPVGNNGSAECYTASAPNPGAGVVQYTSDPLERSFTMMGIPNFEMSYSATGTDYWVTVRLFDQDPSGSLRFVTRGVCKTDAVAEPDVDCSSFALWGNGWTFAKGDRVVVELSQAETPTFRRDNFPSSLSIEDAAIHIPTTVSRLRHDFRD